MKRNNYSSGGAGRGRPTPPPAPKAPLPFNLPSMKREAVIDAATGGIAAAGAKWASPRNPGDAPIPQPASSASSPAAPPPPPAAPAWGGAGVRSLQKKESADFPTLRSAPPPPPQPMPASHAVRPPLRGSSLKPSQSSGKAPAVGEDGDWAEDDDTDLSAPLALPEVSVAPAPSVSYSHAPQHLSHAQYPPRDLQSMHGRGPPSGRHQPPAAHWAVAIKQQQAEIERHSQRRPVAHHIPDPIALPDIKIVEEQKKLMKAKAESAQEAWRLAEQERLQIQRERAAQKLRALEMKMSTSGTDSANRPAQHASSAWRSAPPIKVASSADTHGPNASTSAPSTITPKVLLRRPPKDPVTGQSAVLDGGELLASLRAAQPETVRENREVGRNRRRNNRSESNSSEQPRRNQSRHRDNGRPYDGPLENETREQWLDRRRRKTEARDAVRMVIDTCINRAVYGHNRRGRRGGGRRSERGGRDRRDAAHIDEANADSASATSSRQRHDALDHSRHPQDPQTALPSLSLPSSLNPVNESVLTPTVHSPIHRNGPHQPPGFDKVGRDRPPRRGNNSRHGSRRDERSTSPRQRASNAPILQDNDVRQTSRDRTVDPLNPARPTVLQTNRPAPWAPKVPKVAFAPPVSSPGTRTVASVVDAVVGSESDVSLSAGKKGHGSSHSRGQSGGGSSAANGDREGRPKKSKKRGGRNERMKRERREMQAAERAVAQAAAVVEQSTAAAEAAAAKSMSPSSLPSISDNGRPTAYGAKPVDPAGRGAGVAHLTSEDTSSAWHNRANPPTSFVEISRAFSNPKGISLVNAAFVPSPIIPTSTTTTVSNGPSWSASSTWTTQPDPTSKLWVSQAGAAPAAAVARHISSSTSAAMASTPPGPSVGRSIEVDNSTTVNVSGTLTDVGGLSDAPKSAHEPKPRRGRSKRGGAGSSNRRRKQSTNVNDPSQADGVTKPKTEVKSPTTSLSLNESAPTDLVGNTATASASSDVTRAATDIGNEARRSREPRRGSRSGRRGRQRPRESGEDGNNAGANGYDSRNNNEAHSQGIEGGGGADGGSKAPERGGRNGSRRGRSGRGRRTTRGGHGNRNTRDNNASGSGAAVGGVSGAGSVSAGAESNGARGGAPPAGGVDSARTSG